MKPAQRALAPTGAPAPPRAPRVKRYSLFWPGEDIYWNVQWPIITGRVALTWEQAPEEDQDLPASD